MKLSTFVPKPLRVLLFVALLVALAACGSSPSSSPATPASPSRPSATVPPIVPAAEFCAADLPKGATQRPLPAPDGVSLNTV